MNNRTINDRRALDMIHSHLDGFMWDADTFDAIAEVIRMAGYEIGAPGKPVGRRDDGLTLDEVFFRHGIAVRIAPNTGADDDTWRSIMAAMTGFVVRVVAVNGQTWLGSVINVCCWSDIHNAWAIEIREWNEDDGDHTGRIHEIPLGNVASFIVQ